MLRKAISLGGLLLLAGALVVTLPSSAAAQHGHGGHGGFGGWGGGLGGWGGGLGGWGGGLGGWGGGLGGWNGGYYPGGFGYYGGRGYGWGNYGYYPYYGGSYGWTGPMYGVSGASYPMYGYQSGYYSPVQQSDNNAAHLRLMVPPDARVTIQGAQTQSTGPVREYESPPLTPGKTYTYTIQARWNDNGREVTQTKKVDVAAGSP
jgi:uncharacterized protein (TIGR03000 family)